MHPFLIDWVVNNQHFRIPSYGVMLATAFTASYFISLRRADYLGEDPKHIENLFLLIVAGSVIGARMFHVIFEEPEFYLKNPSRIIAVWEGGYTLYGAMLSCIAVVYGYCKWQKVSYLAFIDIAAEATALGIFFGRIGCFLAGCCWGKASDVPWAVVFNHPDAFSEVHNIPVHPTQLYESFGALCIFIYLHRRFENRKYRGQIFFHGLALYAVLRFLVEMFRGDDYRGYVLGGMISTSQLISLGVLPFIFLGMRLYSRRPQTKN